MFSRQQKPKDTKEALLKAEVTALINRLHEVEHVDLLRLLAFIELELDYRGE